MSSSRILVLCGWADLQDSHPSGYRCMTSLWSGVNFFLGESWYPKQPLFCCPQSSLTVTFVCMSGLFFMYCTEGRELHFSGPAYYRLLGFWPWYEMKFAACWIVVVILGQQTRKLSGTLLVMAKIKVVWYSFTGSGTALTFTHQRKQQSQVAFPSLSLAYLFGKHKMHRSCSKWISSPGLIRWLGHQS